MFRSSGEDLAVLFQKKNDDLRECRYAGVIFRTYLMFEKGDKLYLADFHAMHERIRYEKIINRGGIDSQKIIPFVFEVSAEDMEIFESIKDKLENIGFELHKISASALSVEAVPAMLDDYESVLRELFVEYPAVSESHKWDYMCKTIACKGSARAGDSLSYGEVEHLLDEWYACEFPQSCPHGRPVVTVVDKGFFDKEFKRTGF